MKIGKVEKLVANLLDKVEYVFHVRNVNQALDHRFKKKKKVHRVITFNQNAWQTLNLTSERKNNYLVSEPNYHTTKFFYRLFNSNRNE